ncbi:hypothetical protein I6F11_29750 [Ensifer sp. NBAIM29]|nr:hypothetical protein [Ensifer sp. NBAIM29]
MRDGAAVPNDPGGDGLTLHQQIATEAAGEFKFSGKRRTIEPVEAIPWRWPATAALANEYISDWRDMASKALERLRLSKDTLECIASHVSRRDGTCNLKDRAMASRSGRSLASTKRDIDRLKRLGLLIAEYKPGRGRQRRERLLKLAIPAGPKKSPRIPHSDMTEVVSTYPHTWILLIKENAAMSEQQLDLLAWKPPAEILPFPVH